MINIDVVMIFLIKMVIVISLSRDKKIFLRVNYGLITETPVAVDSEDDGICGPDAVVALCICMRKSMSSWYVAHGGYIVVVLCLLPVYSVRTAVQSNAIPEFHHIQR